MRNIRPPTIALYVALIAIVSSCSASEPVIRDRLDPVTGVTITHANVPLIFYQDRTARAAYASDFVNLGPIRVNRMGQYRYYLWVAVWSTMQNVNLTDEQDGFESIVIFADGEPLELSSSGWTPLSIGAAESIYVKPVASAAEIYYEVTVDQLRLISEASDVRLKSTGSQARNYEPWDSQSSAQRSMRAFLEFVSY